MPLLFDFFNRQFISYPPVQTKSFKGKTAIVTGGNVGLGLEACRSLTRLGAERIILACRNVEKGKAAAVDIQTSTSCSPETLEVWQLDLSSFDSIKAFSARVHAELPRLDILIANAGIGTKTFRISQGNEETITINVISTSLIACLLYPKLRQTGEKYKTHTRLTMTTSELYEFVKFEARNSPPGQLFATLADEDKADMDGRYAESKLLEIFFIKQMASISSGITDKVIVNCVAPGFCRSQLLREHSSLFVQILIRLLARPPQVGARTLVYGASAGPETHGQYLPDCKLTATGGVTEGKEGAELQKRVWEELREELEKIQPGVTTLA